MRNRLRALPGNVRGALWMLLGATAFCCLNAAVKAIGPSIPAIEVVFFRSLFGLLALLPFALGAGRQVWRVERPAMHLLRAALGMGAMTLCFVSVARLPLAGATTLFFTKPLFTLLLAALFLGERLRWRRGLATLCGFAGVVVMLRPWDIGIDPAALVAITAALLMAAVMIVIKAMTASERPLTMVVYFSAAMSLGALPPSLWVWQTPDARQFALLVLTGLLGSLAQYFITRAYHAGEASVVTPVDYSQVVVAGVIGYAAFAEIPDLWMLAGAVAVVGSSWYVVAERR